MKKLLFFSFLLSSFSWSNYLEYKCGSCDTPSHYYHVEDRGDISVSGLPSDACEGDWYYKQKYNSDGSANSHRQQYKSYCFSTPSCPVGQVFDIETEVCASQCGEGEHFDTNLNTCVCDSEYVTSPDGGCMLPPDCKIEDDHSHYDEENFLCVCDQNTTKSPFSGKCVPVCGDGTSDQDCDGIPNDDDDDIDGDDIPNGQDDDIDGDGVPNSSDSTPDGGSGGGGTDTDPIEDQCIISDINSHSSGGICVCNINYHVDTISNFCVADTPAEHDTSCDYEDSRGGYPFQQTTFTQSGCQYFINFWNGGSSYKKDSCDYWGCYYAKDGSGDSNGTTPNDQDGDGIPDDQDTDNNNDGIDDNGTNTPTDGGLFAKASDLMGSAHGVDIDLKVSGASPEAITVSIMGHTYVIYDPVMISDSVWNTITLVMKWIAIVSAVITVFTTI